jgi:hypothetical protein
MRRSKSTKTSIGLEVWQPKSAPSPYRSQIKAQVPFPPERDVEVEHDLKWIDPTPRRVKGTDPMAK